MNEMERAKFKEMAHQFFDVDMPDVMKLEIEKVPDEYKFMVKGMMALMMPMIINMIDKKIDELAGA